MNTLTCTKMTCAHMVKWSRIRGFQQSIEMAQMGGISLCNHCSQFRVTDRMKFSNSHHGAKQRRNQAANTTQPSQSSPEPTATTI